MRSVLDTDRGPSYTLCCMAIAFGFTIGAIAVPLLMLSMWIAGIIAMGLAFTGVIIASIIASIVYYTGVFLASYAVTIAYAPIAVWVDSWLPSVWDATASAVKTVSTALNTAYLTASCWAWSASESFSPYIEL